MIYKSLQDNKNDIIHQMILSPKFIKIRHYGFLASRNKTQILDIIQKQLGDKNNKITMVLDWKELFQRENSIAYNQCPKCKKGQMNIVDVSYSARADPQKALMPNLDFDKKHKNTI